ncbi:MAG: hypothetical protein N2039_08145 [Gemmataceae bacterium]|nr:hypothetical protein [Gemmataceae bacterium]
MWLRVFALAQVEVPLQSIQEFLRAQRLPHFIEATGDDLGWKSFRAGDLVVERYLVEADDLRGELDTWAAVVESWEAGAPGTKLMQQIIAVRQMFTISADHGSEELARFLAQRTDGFYYVDDVGFFDASGSPILREPTRDTD